MIPDVWSLSLWETTMYTVEIRVFALRNASTVFAWSSWPQSYTIKVVLL